MGTLGSYFRNAREARGLDLRDAAQQTRISINYLKAIEQEDFSKLPGEVFVKGFLKNYARFLRLPEDEVVKRYGECINPPSGSAPAAVPAAPKADGQKHGAVEMRAEHAEVTQPGGPSLEPFLWGGIILVGLVLFLLVALPASKSVHERGKVVSSRPTATDSVSTVTTSTAETEKLYLEIIAQEDGWVLVRTDASPQKKAVLKKGEGITWSADERFLLSYASVGSLKIILNGNELTVNGPKNAVVRDLIVTAKGIAFQKVEAEQPPRPRKPKPLTQATSTAQPPVQTAPAPPAATIIPPPTVPPAEPTVPPRD
ncbi:MAG: RodZ domain-containing protein [Nitrospirota bacterium]